MYDTRPIFENEVAGTADPLKTAGWIGVRVIYEFAKPAFGGSSNYNESVKAIRIEKTQRNADFPIMLSFPKSLSRRGDMKRTWTCLLLCISACTLLMAGLSQLLAADGGGDGAINSVELSRAGLQKMWTSQAELSSSDQLKFVQLHVSNTRAAVFFEIHVGEEVRKSFASLDRDAFGNRLGYERAKELADLQREIIEQQVAASLADKKLSQVEYSDIVYGTSNEAVTKRQELLEAAKQKVEVHKYVEPRMTLYTLNGKNVLQAFDAETGDVRWSRQVGSRDGYAMGLAANDAMVAVVSGTKVYCLEADQGRILWSHSCDGPPNAAPAMSHTHIFVPLMDGRLEAFNIAKDGIGSEYYVSHGRISAQPLVTGRTVSWPTDKGHYNVAYFDRIGAIRYRVRANGSIVATPAKLGRVLFFTAMDGYIYAIDEVLGSIYWEFSTGSSISQSPLAVDDAIYFVTDNEELYKVDSKTGETPASWPKSISRIHRLIGAANEFVYAQDSSGNLVTIRADTGSRVSSIYVGDGVHLLNGQSDRIFLVSNSGAIQCLRQINQVHPKFNVPVSETIAGGDPDSKPKRRATKFNEQIRNPFETKEELNQDPFIASEPVYDNPFLVATEGEVDPFILEEKATKDQPTEKTPANATVPEIEEKPPADPEDPFGGGEP